MRLLVKFRPKEDSAYSSVNNYTIQGFIYSFLKRSSEFESYHDKTGFKYFCFSNIFPVSDFKTDETKNLIISSPSSRLIKAVEKEIKKIDSYYLGKIPIEVESVSLFKPRLERQFITSTPVVLYEKNRKNIYFSMKKSNEISFFMERLKENALKKYNAFYDDNYQFDGNIFDRLQYSREVAVRLKRADKMFIVIGTLWKNLEKFNMDNKRFYRFLLDCGVGEKNSLGFGMLNTVGSVK
ncbi:CRISPR-associated endoribonuclease Cas6 [Methanothermobacter thermautotrophicus]|uniref:CRISPR-associated endoribonuclease Cas6 n=1 Tax=Methanothermobacter thermautotrophicus TaxID=145262 RepID=A0A842YPK8_METTF|nr:CRISPR-associated endoribonuclease Cas6 [Methanothermobacter thermautotrophicus]MBE2900301.1 CRISPR-associated endoribonuclease Cas6 [Methanothermobacter thermautotrophicus]